MDFNALNFKNTPETIKGSQKNDPFNFSDPISPQTYNKPPQQYKHQEISQPQQQKILKGPDSKSIKPIRK